MLSSRLFPYAGLVRVRCLSTAQRKQPTGFISKVLENIKQELTKDKEMKESIAKFREEAQKLEQTDALKQARRKFEIVENEASKSSEVLKEGLDSVKGKFQEAYKEVSASEFAKKASQVGDKFGKQAQSVGQTITDTSAKIANTSGYRAVSNAASAVKEEIVESEYGDRIYRPPIKLRKRIEVDKTNVNEDVISTNSEALGMELHKDSKFYQSWEKFRDNNPYVNKVLDWKIKYDESENPVLKASKLLTNKVSEIMGGLFQRTELSETLTEIIQLDPSFDKEKFIRDCERDIIPNILEAHCRGDIEVLQDWCYETAFAVLSHPIKAAQQQGLKIDSRILDISHVDLAMGKVLEQGPVLVMTFTAQQISFVQDKSGKIVEGDPEKVMRVNHVWVLCRDRTELDPRAAWRLLELSASASEQLL